jgi:calcineurin-like phosphoesterase
VIEKDGVRWAVGQPERHGLHQRPRIRRFHVVDRILAKLPDEADYVIVDFHAEATSEKVAMGGTWTAARSRVRHPHHVPTADARVLPGGTGVHLGRRHDRRARRRDRREAEQIIQRVRHADAGAFETADEDPWVMGCLVTSERGWASSIEQDRAGERKRCRRAGEQGTPSGNHQTMYR